MSNGITFTRGFLAVLAASAVMAGCDYRPAPPSATQALRVGFLDPSDSGRQRHDLARGRIWVLNSAGVFLYHTSTGKLVEVALPSWQWVDVPYSCPPDIVIGPEGEAVVTSNVVPVLWRIDPRTLAVSAHELALDADTDKDVGFSGIAYSPEHGAFFAISDVHGSLWRIDPLLKTGRKIALSQPVREACDIAAARSADRHADFYMLLFEKETLPMDAPITATELKSALGSSEPPLVIDVRRSPAFLSAPEMISGALRRDPGTVADWARTLPRAAGVVVYCVHGHEVSQGTAQALNERGIAARYLEGGIEEGWKGDGGTVDHKPAGASTRWVTRERPKIDRIACPWLVARFVDPEAEFLYVAAGEVRSAAKERDAVAYDIPDVHFSHDGDLCSFDAFIKHYRLKDPALKQLALIVRGADTAKLELAPQSSGLVAISLGLSRLFGDDQEMLRHGMVMYDALYRWCREGQDEVHTWNPAAYR